MSISMVGDASTVGIDYGTTNTAAAVQLRIAPLSLEAGRGILPSVVAFPPSGVTLVGSRARRRRAIDPQNTIFSSKRLIGRAFRAPEVEEFRSRYPFDLVERDEHPAFKTRAGYLSPADVAGLILTAVARELPVVPQETRAVVAVPSRFRDAARQATVEAVGRAGFEHVVVIDEPVATAHAYLTGKSAATGYAAIYDLGGGTFDLAIVDCSRRPFEVVAYGGDLYLGGDDIDYGVATWAAEEIARIHRWDLRDDRVVFDRLVMACERAKITLCQQDATHIDLAAIDPAAPISYGASGANGFLTVERRILEGLALNLVYRTFVICDAVLADAGVKTADVEQVFLAGGSTQLPMVRQAVAQYFGREPRTDYHPMEVVAMGASIASEP